MGDSLQVASFKRMVSSVRIAQLLLVALAVAVAGCGGSKPVASGEFPDESNAETLIEALGAIHSRPRAAQEEEWRRSVAAAKPLKDFDSASTFMEAQSEEFDKRFAEITPKLKDDPLKRSWLVVAKTQREKADLISKIASAILREDERAVERFQNRYEQADLSQSRGIRVLIAHSRELKSLAPE